MSICERDRNLNATRNSALLANQVRKANVKYPIAIESKRTEINLR